MTARYKNGDISIETSIIYVYQDNPTVNGQKLTKKRKGIFTNKTAGG